MVLILDDVFSGLDATSEERIFSRLLGTHGLLRRLGTTVILVTHAAHRLSYADHIVALSPQGTILEQGKLGQLLTNEGYVFGLAARHTVECEDTSQEDLPPAKQSGNGDTARENAAADLNRPGNWAIYHYYFTSVGLLNVAVWSFVMICYSLLLSFPSKLIPVTFPGFTKWVKISG
jgi:ABC-type multidrug transport system ATPase subunit